MQKKWILALSLSLTLTTLGCAVPAIPFLDGAPAQDSAPIMVDADTLSTMIAEAAAQKVAQTLAAIPPTLVPTAALTQTPAPTATQPPTPTLTPTAYPQKGSELIAAEEGYIYYDYSTGYQIITPPNWLAIRPGEVEYAEAWGLPVASYPAVSSALQSMQSLDPNTYRLFVLDTQDGHFENSYLSNINILLSPADGASLDEIFAASVLTLPDQIPGLLVTDSNITQTEHATRMGLITSEWGSQLAAGESLRIYQQQALFVLNDTALVITFSSTVDFKDNILADFETVLTSLTPLE